ncbi:hypothetical protein F3J23_14875 [Chryseobacterium sp. Tr-659]|uniref:hypothetical protein n=1 Tax=Chryseobacterium sp. Tr-659 TaxID=2608340 RepID=UPI001423F4BB|nr:hypothetical protein [Chryseobacterium sp. Tr-659]NIF06730.1 hypothetical protein [Chryseobacterium sp. Tr-659]
MIKSKIHHNWYLWFFFLVMCEFGIAFGLVKAVIKKIDNIHENSGSLIPIIILIIIILSLLLVIKDFKYIIIDKQKNSLKYYSILRPLGSTLKLDDFDNKIKTSETSVRGEYEVIYLVKKGYTVFKISGLFYDNFKEIDSSIKLKRIYNYKFNLKLYLQLLFTGKIRIKEE